MRAGGWQRCSSGSGALYAVGVLLTFWYLTPDGASASFFPPAGLTLAALLLAPRRTWPWWLATIALIEIAIDLARTPPFSWRSVMPLRMLSSR